MKLRDQALKVSKDINPESIKKAHAVLSAFAASLEQAGSVQEAASKAAAQTGAHAEVRRAKDKDTK